MGLGRPGEFRMSEGTDVHFSQKGEGMKRGHLTSCAITDPGSYSTTGRWENGDDLSDSKLPSLAFPTSIVVDKWDVIDAMLGLREIPLAAKPSQRLWQYAYILLHIHINVI